MDSAEQQRRALDRGNARRWAIATLRANLRAGEDDIADVIRRREPLVAGYSIFDVLRLTAGSGNKVTMNHQVMGSRAVYDGVNLLISLERASEHTINWTINYINNHKVVAGHHYLGVKKKLPTC